jgi:hypothetical protein
MLATIQFGMYGIIPPYFVKQLTASDVDTQEQIS